MAGSNADTPLKKDVFGMPFLIFRSVFAQFFKPAIWHSFELNTGEYDLFSLRIAHDCTLTSTCALSLSAHFFRTDVSTT